PEVLAKGAAALILEDVDSIYEDAKGDEALKWLKVVKPDITVIKVDDTREALAFMSAAYFDHPADVLKVVGITGTKGKTTTTYMIREALQAAGHKVGLIGTIEAIIGNEHIPAHNTTPESYELQRDFAAMLDAGCDICVMEVSSQGLMMHRVDGFTFELGIFTNIEPDHIGPNEHKDFEDYLHCKALLFKKCRYGIFNADADHLDEVLEEATCDKSFYGIGKGDYQAGDIRLWQDGGHLGVEYHISGRLNEDMRIEVPGRFSVYNSLAAVAVCDHFGTEPEVLKKALLHAKAKGRIEMIHVSDEFSLMIDYAHNAMALESLLTSLREYEPGRLVTLFGCGGNRDRNRRFEMGEVSGRLSDLTIITSDNPRFEEPSAIIDDIETGIRPTGGKYIRIEDRKEAIRYAIEHGKPGDIVILAGKGHEDYQEIRGVKHPMDERVLIDEVLKEIAEEKDKAH
ncbi:MAG: UDP-N-acetylmuramoyl-L-alanyl-D-glutamate--2,6-diaminopimelate ligase, partial [Lachnospiraceae bacterium]|nr:UDP-N-acetylmuramoyl-L-alanyl-D-glutamate--2,6-diaminopimelate ligase [Lachnospiraceae bacterium]